MDLQPIKSLPSDDHNEKLKKWRFYALRVVPVVLLLAQYFCFHRNHERQPFKDYEFMRVRSKKFPWGDGNKTLFHNPDTNPLPGGYEGPPSEAVHEIEESKNEPLVRYLVRDLQLNKLV